MHLDLEVTPHLARVAGTPDMQRRHERRRREEQPACISSAQNHHLPAPPPSPFVLPSTPRNWGLYVPLKSRKRGAGLRGVADGAEADAVAQEDGQGDESREPEQHRQGLGGQDAEFVRGDGEARGRDDEVGQREERPDGGDDQDVHFPRRELVPLAGPPVRDCGGGKVSGGCQFGYG